MMNKQAEVRSSDPTLDAPDMAAEMPGGARQEFLERAFLREFRDTVLRDRIKPGYIPPATLELICSEFQQRCPPRLLVQFFQRLTDREKEVFDSRGIQKDSRKQCAEKLDLSLGRVADIEKQVARRLISFTRRIPSD